MHLITGLSAAALTVAVVGGMGVGLLGSVADPASSPVPIDASTWAPYTSDRYGFSISHPVDWIERPAVGTWTLAAAPDFLSPASEGFQAPGDSILATAWSVPVDPGTTVESWLGTYCPLNTTPCTGLADRTTPVTLDGHPGSLVRFTDDVQGFIPVDDRMYVVALWRAESAPAVAGYGGATRLLEGFLSTMELLPGGPAIDTSDWTSYVSDRYGFSIGHPADWTERPAERTWTLASDADFLSPASEGFQAPDETILVTAWSVPVLPGTTVESWLEAYCPLNTTPCTGLADRTIPVTLDGHAGSLVRFTDDVQAFIPVDDRMYVVSVWRPESDPASTLPYGGATRLLKGYLSTMKLLPGDPAANGSPSPQPS